MKLWHGLGLAGTALLAVMALPTVWTAAGNVPSRFVGEAVAGDTSSAHLKAVLAVGHGSAVHIGDGYVVTAGHVANGLKEINLRSEAGTTYTADVLWINTAFDIAFLRMRTPTTIAAVDLNCAESVVGSPVVAYGNPADMEFVFSFGKIVGKARQHGPWKSVVPVDMTIIPGMSGGGVVDTDGKLVGIAVGVMLYGYGLAGMGYVVPASVICDLRGVA